MNSEKTIRELNNSLSYVMSQGSMELFHTNFWAGLIRKYPAFAEAFIGPDSIMLDLEAEDKGVVREKKLSKPSNTNDEESDETTDYGKGKKSIDILFRLSDGRAIVFENKFKSIPTKKQLCMYYDLLPNTGLSFYKGILCTPFRTDIVVDEKIELEGRCSYNYLGYSQLLVKLHDIADTIKDSMSVFDYELVKSYCRDTKNVLSILEDKINEDKESKNYRIYVDPLMDKMGLNDICSKLSGETFMSYFKMRCEDEYKNLYEHLFLNVDFSNKNVIIDFRFDTRIDKDNTNDHYFLIGIQLERNQFRRVFEMRKEKVNPEKKVFDLAKKYNWFGQKKKGGIIVWDKEYKSGIQKQYCKYEGLYSDDVNTHDVNGKERKYMFVYQWKYLMGTVKYDGKSVTYDDLYNDIISNLLIANEIYNQIGEDEY